MRKTYLRFGFGVRSSFWQDTRRDDRRDNRLSVDANAIFFQSGDLVHIGWANGKVSLERPLKRPFELLITMSRSCFNVKMSGQARLRSACLVPCRHFPPVGGCCGRTRSCRLQGDQPFQVPTDRCFELQLRPVGLPAHIRMDFRI